MDYEKLRELYPKIITKDQFYKIAHISKRKATWILENGIVPCADSGKKTRRFKIALDDVIEFLQRRDMGELEFLIPKNIFSSGNSDYAHEHRIMREIVDSDELCEHLLSQWEELPDVINMKEAKELCGYGDSALLRWIERGCVKAVLYHSAYLISKESLAKFLCSDMGQLIVNKSDFHGELIDEFIEGQKNSDIVFEAMSL